MVVDDDHHAADVVGEFLQTLGAEVRVVYGGQEAIDLAPDFQPQVVILDVNMPSIDGFQTCRRLRQQPWSPGVLIIAYSGQPLHNAVLVAAGFNQVVTKGDPPDAFETILIGLAP